MNLQQRFTTRPADRETVTSSDCPPFPSARYFQIHFEYLQELLADLRQQLRDANAQIALLSRRLDGPTDKPDSSGL
jgi:hypothetical protein